MSNQNTNFRAVRSNNTSTGRGGYVRGGRGAQAQPPAPPPQKKRNLMINPSNVDAYKYENKPMQANDPKKNGPKGWGEENFESPQDPQYPNITESNTRNVQRPKDILEDRSKVNSSHNQTDSLIKNTDTQNNQTKNEVKETDTQYADRAHAERNVQRVNNPVVVKSEENKTDKDLYNKNRPKYWENDEYEQYGPETTNKNNYEYNAENEKIDQRNHYNKPHNNHQESHGYKNQDYKNNQQKNHHRAHDDNNENYRKKSSYHDQTQR